MLNVESLRFKRFAIWIFFASSNFKQQRKARHID